MLNSICWNKKQGKEIKEGVREQEKKSAGGRDEGKMEN